jgi:hypothetical protein
MPRLRAAADEAAATERVSPDQRPSTTSRTSVGSKAASSTGSARCTAVASSSARKARIWHNSTSLRRSLAPSPTNSSISAAISCSRACVPAYSSGDTGFVPTISRMAAV